MAVTQKVTLYNNKFTVPPVINAVQNDTDRLIEAYFGDFTLQVGMTGVLSFIRSDGTHYEVSATLNTGANTATAELDQALTQAGVTQAQLKITDSGNVGSTFTFMIKVQPDVAGISQQQDGYSAEELAQEIADNASAIANIENVKLPKKADQDGYYEDLTSGTSLAVIGTPTTESVPYLFRRSASIGVRESDKLVGGTVAWNQLVQNGNFASASGWATGSGTGIAINNNECVLTIGTATWNQDVRQAKAFNANHKYLFHVFYKMSAGLSACHMFVGVGLSHATGYGGDYSATYKEAWAIEYHDSSTSLYARAGLKEPNTNGVYQNETITIKNFNIFDLTAMLGTTIADYVYGLETATAGSGIALLKSWGLFTKDYYAYDSGSLQSVKTSAHKTVGKNLCPKFSSATGSSLTYTANEDGSVLVTGTNTGTAFYAIQFTLPKGTYVLSGAPTGGQLTIRSAQGGGAPSSAFSGILDDYGSGATFTVSETASAWLNIRSVAGTHDQMYYPMIRVSGADATYVPYESHTYPLSLIDLRGIPKLDAQNKLYYDGDEYKSDGTVVRRYNFITISSTTATTNMNTSEYGNWVRLTNLPVSVKDDSRVCLLTSSQAVTTSYDDRTTLPSSRKAYIDNNGAVCLRVATNDNVTTASQILALYDGCQIQYELVTPTTETADPFHDPQICSPYGTEEYIDTRDVPVPVGHETEYYTDPVAEIERVAVQVPVPPTANGTYRLTCVVSGGVPTYSWTS